MEILDDKDVDTLMSPAWNEQLFIDSTTVSNYLLEIERVCEEADFEIDLSTGKSWTNPNLGLIPGSIFPQYLTTHVPPVFIRPPADPEAPVNCNLAVVMRINMATYSAGKLKLVRLGLSEDGRGP